MRTLRHTGTLLAMLWLSGLMSMPTAAQAPAGDWLERMRAERSRAADAALLQAQTAPLKESLPPATPPSGPTEPVAFAPGWQQQVGIEEWKLLRESLAAESVPEALLAVGWVESRFDPQAISPRGARGIWQLMPATARRYGLVVGPGRDERTDPARSTRAAARHLADLQRQFGDWLLALAAYNAGAERVEAAITRAGSRNFWGLRALLPAETRDYVPAVLAAIGSPPGAVTGDTTKSPPPSSFAGRVLFAVAGPSDRQD